MKRVGYIYEKIWDVDNIKKAILKSSLGKRKQRRVKKVLNNIDAYANTISKMIREKSYKPSPYVIKQITDGASKKVRTIHKPRYYPDQIIHWSLMLQIQSVIMRGMYAYNCGSVPKRGIHYAKKALRKWIDRDIKNTKYCLKMDISKFYPSISNDVLKQKLRSKIKDQDCLWLLGTIIDSSIGLPIGNYTSQWLANFFLEDMDHFIKEQLQCKYYIRYVDDIVILGANKKRLHYVRKEIERHLNEIELKVKRNWQVFRISSRAVDFLGFRFFRSKTILRKSNALRIRRRVKKVHEKKTVPVRDAQALISYHGWLTNSDSYQFYRKHFLPFFDIKQLRGIVARVNN